MTLAIAVVLLLAGTCFVVLMAAMRLGARDDHGFQLTRETQRTL